MLAPSRASGNLLKEIAWETMDFWAGFAFTTKALVSAVAVTQ